MKNLSKLVVLVLFFCVSSQTFAQSIHGKKALYVSLITEGNRQWQSKTEESPFSLLFTPNSIGTTSAFRPSRFTDGYGQRFALTIGRKSFIQKGNYQNWNVLIGGSTWKANRGQDTFNSIGLVTGEERVPNGKVNQIYTGLAYTYAICITKNSEKFRAYIGFRGDLVYQRDDLKPDLTTIFPAFQNIYSVRSFIIPEISYRLENDMILSLGMGLPIIRTSYVSAAANNTRSSIEPQRYSGLDIDMGNWGNELNFEFSVAWILGKK